MTSLSLHQGIHRAFSVLQMKERSMNGTILGGNDSASKDMVRMIILIVTKAPVSQKLLKHIGRSLVIFTIC